MENVSNSIDHSVLDDVVASSAILLRSPDDVDASSENVATDANAFTLKVL